MRVDIEQLSEADLIDLNHRIVARLQMLRQIEAHASMLEFRIGQRVSFQPDGHPPVTGMITKYNKKTVSIVTDDGHRWNVSPQFLKRGDIQTSAATAHDNIISLPRRDKPPR